MQLYLHVYLEHFRIDKPSKPAESYFGFGVDGSNHLPKEEETTLTKEYRTIL